MHSQYCKVCNTGSGIIYIAIYIHYHDSNDFILQYMFKSNSYTHCGGHIYLYTYHPLGHCNQIINSLTHIFTSMASCYSSNQVMFFNSPSWTLVYHIQFTQLYTKTLVHKANTYFTKVLSSRGFSQLLLQGSS